MKYIIYDVDDITDEDYDIKGDDYAELIDRCFKYGSVFSLMVPVSRPDLIEDIKQYAVMPKLSPEKKWILGPDNGGKADMSEYMWFYPDPSVMNIKYFLCNEETKKFLIKNLGCVFEYLSYGKTPEDLTIYGEYPSDLFHETTHEGYAILHLKNGEDFSDLIEKQHWKQVDEDFYPCWG